MTTGGPTYGGYLHLEELLDAQHPLSRPQHHDEMLFIIQHQTSELWMKLLIHELGHAASELVADDVRRSLKALARAKQVLRQLTAQWSVLATLTPHEYAGFRQDLGSSSGFQSWQYRSVEILLGAKDARWLDVFADEPVALAGLTSLLEQPSVYDTFWSWMAGRGHRVPAAVLERDPREAWAQVPELVDVIEGVYRDPGADWEAYETAESLLDVDDRMAEWRFHHVTTVERIIGALPGTGGTSGTGYLRGLLARSFFPELHSVRNRLATL